MRVRKCLIATMSIAAALSLPVAANAAPIIYDFYVVTDGTLGSWVFSKALVHFRIASDTTNVSHPTLAGQQIALSSTGTYQVTVMANGRTETATFKPGQLFVSVDQTNGGVGVGSYDSAGNPLPTYPIGIQDGIPDCLGLDYQDCISPSAAVTGLLLDLTGNTMLSGRAWSDPCFAASGPCDSSVLPPLATDRGAFSLAEPYTTTTDSAGGLSYDPLVAGVFRATLVNSRNH